MHHWGTVIAGEIKIYAEGSVPEAGLKNEKRRLPFSVMTIKPATLAYGTRDKLSAQTTAASELAAMGFVPTGCKEFASTKITWSKSAIPWNGTRGVRGVPKK